MIRLSAPAPWQPAFLVALRHGVSAGVHLPPGPGPVPAEVLDRLHPEERAFAVTLGGYRQVQFVGGRLALGALFADVGARRAPVLPDEHGAPVLPEGLAGSVSHKQDLAVALLARGGAGLGVDLEETDRERPGVAARVLRPAELDAVAALPPERRWTDTMVRFAVKEAVYKALEPFVRRYIGFGEVEVWPSPDGTDVVHPLLPEAGGFTFEAWHTWVEGRVLATVRVRRAPGARGA